jgi:hypothetical protein
VHSLPEGGAVEGVSLRVFPNLRRTQKYENLPLHKQLSVDFLTCFLFRRKEIFPWEHIKLSELPLHNALGFCWGRSLKITHRNEKEVVLRMR